MKKVASKIEKNALTPTGEHGVFTGDGESAKAILPLKVLYQSILVDCILIWTQSSDREVMMS